MTASERPPGAIVIGSDFRALGVVRSLGRRRVPCIVIDNLPRSAWFSRYVKQRIYWPGALDSAEFLAFLLRLADERHLEQWVLFPMPDDTVELIARHHEELAARYRLVTQDWDVVQWANDKSQTYRMAEELHVPYPKTWYPQSEDELCQLDITYPVIIKPAISLRLQHSLHLKALPAHNFEELRAQYQLATSVMEPETILLQEIIPGTGRSQYSVAAYCQDGRVLTSMTARRTRQYPIDYGLGSSFVEAVEVPVIAELASRLIEHMRVSGMLEVEFKYDERAGVYKLLDINLRPWGWHTLALACGLDFPWMQYSALFGAVPPARQPRYGAHWVRMLTDLPAGWQEMRAGITTPGAYVRSLLGQTVFSVFAWSDPLPAVGDFASAVLRSLKKRSGKQQKQSPLPAQSRGSHGGKVYG